jgi:SAM-dependent methyltransferase
VSVFAGYSRYYDLLYRDKDYVSEANYVVDLIRRHSPNVKTALEIGCGTGAHAATMAGLGLEIAGVDMSEGMLELADARRASLDDEIAARVTFEQGDARTVRLGKKFDAVMALFHVMSYQTSNEDLAAVFATAREHVKQNGIFLFDCWYGPAVLRQWPTVTTKHLEDETTEVNRRADPVMHPNENVVDVNYTVMVTDKVTGTVDTLRETHRMRYLFTPEIEAALETAGMRLVDSRGWMTDDAPGFSTWGACFIARG